MIKQKNLATLSHLYQISIISFFINYTMYVLEIGCQAVGAQKFADRQPVCEAKISGEAIKIAWQGKGGVLVPYFYDPAASSHEHHVGHVATMRADDQTRLVRSLADIMEAWQRLIKLATGCTML